MNKSFVGISSFFIAVATLAFQYSCSVPSSQQFVLVSFESYLDSSFCKDENTALNTEKDSVLLLKQLLPLLPADDAPRIAKTSDAEAKKVEKNDPLSAINDLSATTFFHLDVDLLSSRSCYLSENNRCRRLIDFYTPYRGPPALSL